MDLYIIAAGNGSRMDVRIPKALYPITNDPCLTTTLQQIGNKFRRVFVVTNVLVQRHWQRYLQELESFYPELAQMVINLPIQSGLGDGHATLLGLLAAERIEGVSLSQDVVITWGDVFFVHGETIDELPPIPKHGAGILPVVYESNPYVALVTDEHMRCVSADLSKLGECHDAGFHDQSVFRFDLSKLKASLGELHNSFWKGSRYMCAQGELSLLYVIHHLYNAESPVYAYQCQYPTRTFNTAAEVAILQEEICSQWKRKFRDAYPA